MTNKAYNLFCALVGIVAAIVLYRLFVDFNVGSWFIQPPEPDANGKVSVSAMQTSDVLAGSIELFLSILIAFGGTIISIVTGSLKSLGATIGVPGIWEQNEAYNPEVIRTDANIQTVTELETGRDMSKADSLRESLLIAIESENKALTIALIEEIAGSKYLTGGEDEIDKPEDES